MEISITVEINIELYMCPKFILFDIFKMLADRFFFPQENEIKKTISILRSYCVNQQNMKLIIYATKKFTI